MYRVVIPPPHTPGAFHYRNHAGDELKIVASSTDEARRALLRLVLHPKYWELREFRAVVPEAVRSSGARISERTAAAWLGAFTQAGDPDVIHGATL